MTGRNVMQYCATRVHFPPFFSWFVWNWELSTYMIREAEDSLLIPIISLRNLWRLKAPEVPLSEAKWFKFMHGHRYLKLVLRLKKYFCLEICLSNIKNCSLRFYLFSSSYNRYHRPLLKIWFQFFVSSIKRNWALEHNPNNYVETKKPALELVKCYLKWRRASFLGSITHSRPQLVSHSFDVLVALKVHFKYGDESNLVCPCNVRAPNFS